MRCDKASFRLAQARRTAAERNRSRVGFEVQSRDGHAASASRLASGGPGAPGADRWTCVSPVDGQVGQVQVADRANVTRDAPLLSVVDLSHCWKWKSRCRRVWRSDLAPGMAAELSGKRRQVARHDQRRIPGGRRRAGQPRACASRAPSPKGLRQSQRLSVRDASWTSRDRRADGGARQFRGRRANGYVVAHAKGTTLRCACRCGWARRAFPRWSCSTALRPGDQVVVSGVGGLQ